MPADEATVRVQGSPTAGELAALLGALTWVTGRGVRRLDGEPYRAWRATRRRALRQSASGVPDSEITGG